MKSAKSLRGLRLTVVTVLAAAVVLGVLQTVIMLTSYEFSQQLYYRDAPLPTVMNVLLIAVTIFSAAGAFITSKGRALPTRHTAVSSVTSFFAAVTAFLIFGCFAFDFIGVFVTGSSFSTAAQSSMQVQKIFHYAKVIFAIPAGIHLLAIALGRTPNRLPAMLLGFGWVMWSAMYLITTYFDMSLPINSPPHVLKQIAFAALMLSQLFSLRFILGMGKQHYWITFSLIGTVFGAAASFPMLVLTAFGYYPLSSDILVYGAMLGLTFFTACRVNEYCIAAASTSDVGADEVSETDTEETSDEA